MKKNIIISMLFLASILFTTTQIISNPTGAPQAAAGAPAEGGATCSSIGGCHVGTPTAVSNVITTDIPAAGYTAGLTYNITVSVTGSGMKGFMVSPQNSSGAYLGTLISGSGSKITNTKYITHSTDKSSSPAVWTFQWKAPSAGTGDVTFYGAFAITRYTTQKQVLTVNEKNSTGIMEANGVTSFNIFPNPVVNNLNITFNLNEKSDVKINIISIDGKNAYELYKNNLSSGNQELKLDVNDVRPGIYLLQMQVNDNRSFEKIMIN